MVDVIFAFLSMQLFFFGNHVSMVSSTALD